MFRLDREETTGTDILDCPLPGCDFSWCKRCNQAVVSGLEHSCDGEKELQRLKDAGDLQYCPGMFRRFLLSYAAVLTIDYQDASKALRR